MKITKRDAAHEVLNEMEDWLTILPRTYRPAVCLFALRLPPEKLIEALWVAQGRMPGGGMDAFKYFCGVCHTMLRELKGKYARN